MLCNAMACGLSKFSALFSIISLALSLTLCVGFFPFVPRFFILAYATIITINL